MSDPILFTADADLRARVPKGLPLVITLGGSSDPGGLATQLADYFWDRCEPEEFVRFNTDLLLDYRSRRPVITFDEDHLVDYAPADLTLSLARDEMGAPFLVLSGFEPDFRWDQFVDTVLLLVNEFEVSTTVWSHTVPMPVPHTRPVRMTVSGSREDIIDAKSIWRPRTKLPASIGHVIEYRLYGLGEDVAGFALLVPHYLANTEYPDALLSALDGFMVATGLLFTTDDLREASESFHQQVDRQISESSESAEMVGTLEARYDAYMQDQTVRSSLLGEDGELPTADQIASELENFLAQHREEGPRDDGQRDDGVGDA